MPSYFSRTYLVRRWLLRYLRPADVLELVITLMAATLAWAAWSAHPGITTPAVTVYVLAAIVRWALVLRGRRAKDSVQGAVFWNLCDGINREMFGDHRARFTLFMKDPFRWGRIVPRYRYAPGASDPIAEADRSRARYQRNESITGSAWGSPGEIFLANFPEFQSPQEFEDFYVNRIKIDEEIVSDLSPYMIGVRALITYGLEDTNHRFLGVLSIDFSSPICTLRTEDGQQITVPEVDPDEDGVGLDQDRLKDAFLAMAGVLGAFHSATRSA